MNAQFHADVEKLTGFGYSISDAVAAAAEEDASLLQHAVKNLKPAMPIGDHQKGCASGVVGLPLSVEKLRAGGLPEICFNAEVTACKPDKPYSQYMQSVTEMVNAARAGVLREPKPTTKYDLCGSGYVASSFPGLTVISPPFEDAASLDRDTVATYESLQAIEESFVAEFVRRGIVRGSLPSIPKVAPVPPSTSHVTLADLVYADRYENFMQGTEEERKFIERLQEVLAQAVKATQGHPLRFRVAGVVTMADAIGARLFPAEEVDYARLIDFRDRVYRDPELQRLGLKKSGPFFGHLTLAYLPEGLDSRECGQLADIVKETNLRHFPEITDTPASTQFPIAVGYADVRFFSSMAAYRPLLSRLALSLAVR